ncbi:MAG: AAA family ATPase, partial [Candidatus Pacearchaeota archaeon]|nr:AAA family ATPase [Candidatus Pacearchaeota archaeon]
HNLARTFDKAPKRLAINNKEIGNGGRLGDDFNRSHTWDQVLTGWEVVFERDGVTHWRRPGKNEGISATTNYAGSDLLYVFSTSTEFESERSYDKFGAYVAVNYNGDFKEATRALGGKERVSSDTSGRQPAYLWPEVEDNSPQVRLVCGADFKPAPIKWMWDGWLAGGKLHILAGAPGTGKTTIALALAATITCSGRWPDGTPADTGEVLIWSGEDDPKDTLIPRLLACGADTSRIHFVTGVGDEDGERSFDPARDASILRNAVKNKPIKLLIVDPVVSAVSGDSHKNAEVRRALQPLVDIGASLGCAVLGISHFSKGSAGRDPVERVTGSLAFGALARIVLAAAKLPDSDGGGRLLARAKSNIGLDTGGFHYDLNVTELANHPGLFATQLLWGEAIEGEARELLSKAEISGDPEEQSALDDAKRFLEMLLAEGPVASNEVMREAKQASHTDATIRRAKKALGIEVHKRGFQGKWVWELPKMLKESKDAHPNNMSTFEKNEHLWAESHTDTEVF